MGLIKNRHEANSSLIGNRTKDGTNSKWPIKYNKLARRLYSKIHSNLDGANIFGTIENCSRHGWFEPLRANYGPSQEANGNNLEIFFDFLHNNCMLSVLIRITSSRRF